METENRIFSTILKQEDRSKEFLKIFFKAKNYLRAP